MLSPCRMGQLPHACAFSRACRARRLGRRLDFSDGRLSSHCSYLPISYMRCPIIAWPLAHRLCNISSLLFLSTHIQWRWLIEHPSSVTSYSTASATLCLQHQCPRDARDRALVDVKLLLETLKTENTQTGEWVNIIGYITASSVQQDPASANHKRAEVHVQALVLWSAGPLDIDRYEASLRRIEEPEDAPDG